MICTSVSKKNFLSLDGTTVAIILGVFMVVFLTTAVAMTRGVLI